jgi:hypothetical protein
MASIFSQGIVGDSVQKKEEKQEPKKTERKNQKV